MTAPVRADFTLVDHHGTPVTAESYRGLWCLVFFGFTHCRAVCPRALRRLSDAVEALGPLAEEVQGLYVTVDPARDTPRRLLEFLQEDYPRFVGLTGTEPRIEAAKNAFGVFARRRADPDDPDGYQVPHTAIAYLLDPSTRYRAHYPDTVPTERITAELRDLVSAG